MRERPVTAVGASVFQAAREANILESLGAIQLRKEIRRAVLEGEIDI
jgi:hypothetical protein